MLPGERMTCPLFCPLESFPSNHLNSFETVSISTQCSIHFEPAKNPPPPLPRTKRLPTLYLFALLLGGDVSSALLDSSRCFPRLGPSFAPVPIVTVVISAPTESPRASSPHESRCFSVPIRTVVPFEYVPPPPVSSSLPVSKMRTLPVSPEAPQRSKHEQQLSDATASFFFKYVISLRRRPRPARTDVD